MPYLWVTTKYPSGIQLRAIQNRYFLLLGNKYTIGNCLNLTVVLNQSVNLVVYALAFPRVTDFLHDHFHPYLISVQVSSSKPKLPHEKTWNPSRLLCLNTECKAHDKCIHYLIYDKQYLLKAAKVLWRVQLSPINTQIAQLRLRPWSLQILDYIVKRWRFALYARKSTRKSIFHTHLLRLIW